MRYQSRFQGAALALLVLSICASARASFIDAALGNGPRATQSTTQFPASNGVDGNFGNFTHTISGDPTPTWAVDLGASMRLDSIVVSNRGDGCCQSRLRDITVEVLDYNDVPVYVSALLNPENILGGDGLGGPAQLSLPGLNVLGRKIRLTRTPDPDLSGTGGQGNPDEGSVLSIGEVDIRADNLALGRPAGQSSDYAGGAFPAGNATDGNLGNFTHTDGPDSNATWQVDLGANNAIDSIILRNRGDGCCQNRLQDITVTLIGADGFSTIAQVMGLNSAGAGPDIIAVDFHQLFGGTRAGRYVRVNRVGDAPGVDDHNANVLSLGEVQVFGVVPEPSSLALCGLGSLMLLGLTLRRKC